MFNNLKKVSADWFNQNWYYRQAVNISNSAGPNQTDYQVSISLNTSALVTAGKLQSNCSDIRVTDVNGKLLPYWIETGVNACNTTTTVIWTKVPSIPTSGQTVYVYYGNPNATDAQNGSNVFLFFDDFSGSLAKWTNPAGCAATNTSGYMNIASSSSCDSAPVYVTGLNYSDTTGYILEFKGKFTSGGGGRLQVYQRVRNTNSYLGRFWINGTGTTNYQEWTGSFGSNTNVGSNNMSADTWYDLKAKVLGNNNTFYVNGASIGSTTSGASLTPFTDFTFGLGEYNTAVQYDDVRVRKTASTEPTNSNASEEKGPAPIGWWKLDDGQGSTANNSARNANNGTLGNYSSANPTWVPEGQCISGKCLSFNGTATTGGYVNAGTNTDISNATEMTVSAWINIKQLHADYQAIVSDQWSKFYLGFSPNSRGLWWQLRNPSSGGVGYITYTLPNADQWYFVTGVASEAGGTVLYVNGVRVASDATPFTLIKSSGNIIIGADSTGSAADYFNGFIDDVKIYPYARTAAQVLADYNSRGSISSKGTSANIGSKTQDWMTQGLVGYWKMDESAWTVDCSTLSVIDSSGNGNNGKACPNSTGPAGGAVGKFGNSGFFDGSNDFVDAGTGGTLGITAGDISIAFWMKASVLQTSDIMQKNTTCNGGYTIYMTSAGNVQFIKQCTGGGVSMPTNVSINTWYHFVMTKSGSTGKIYMNGALQATNSINDFVSTDNLWIGKGGDGVFNGTIDEMRIYNRVLSPQDVVNLYNWAPGPVGYWKLDDKVSGNAQTIIDSSGYGNNGTTVWGANASGMNCKVLGKYGGACQFDGADDYLDLGNPASGILDVGIGNFTLSAWIKTSAVNTYNVIAVKGGSAAYYVDLKAGKLNAYIEDGGGWHDLGSGATSANDGNWHHVEFAFTRNENVRYYLDGALDFSTSISAYVNSNLNNAGHFQVGMWSGSEIFTGLIDDVKLYNYVRTQKQVKEDMNAGHPSVGSPVGSYTGYWKFNEGYGGTTADTSVNADTGTLSGATWTNDGKFGRALTFDGVANYVSMANNNSSLNTASGDMTIEAWIRPSALGERSIASKWLPWIFFINSSNQLMFYTRYGGGDHSVHANTVLPAAGVWYHVAAVYTVADARVTFYLNGRQDGNPTFASPMDADGGAAFQIGGYGNPSNYFLGIIDEVKLYPFALTAADIQTEYNQGKSIAMGSLSDTSGLSGGSVASNSASAAYCIPGDTTSCNMPVGEWKMDEHAGSSVNDTSGNNNAGSITGAIWQSSSMCHSGSCLKFDGSTNYVNAGTGASLNMGTSDITIEMWVKRLAYGAIQRLFIKRQSSAPNAWYDLYFDAGDHVVGSIAVSQPSPTYSSFSSTSTIVDANWHHVVAVFNRASNGQIYIDGVANGSPGSISANSGSISNTGTVFIGAYGVDSGPPAAQYFNGLIDDVKVFNYARTPAQIAWDYNRGKPVGWWRFDECQGTVANDSSGNNYTGTINISGGTQTTVGTCASPTDATGSWYNGRVGKYNSAMSFDGSLNDYVSIPNLSIASGSFTLEAWVNPNNPSSYGTIMGYGSTRRILLQQTSGLLLTQFGGDLFSVNRLPFGSWSHVVYKYDSGANLEYFYINGKYDIQHTPSSTPTWNAAFKIGQYDLANYPYSGLIDDVKVYNYALTPRQILLDYNQGSAVRFGPTAGKP